MIRLAPIEEIIQCALYTGRITDERPMSLMITAQVEHGKTEMLLRFREAPVVTVMTDVTAYGINQQRGRFTWIEDRPPEKTHIIVPDILTPLSRARSNTALIGYLIPLMEEGLTSIETYATSFTLKVPMRIGILTSITRGSLRKNIDTWIENGFLSRFLVISYSYSRETAGLVRDFIASQEWGSETPFSVNGLPAMPIDVAMNRVMARQIGAVARYLSQESGEFTAYGQQQLEGFRLQRQLQALCKGRALVNGRREVTQDDVSRITTLAEDHMNFRYKEI